MQRQEIPEITEIKIPRSCLQSSGHENPLQQLFMNESSLNHLERIINTITETNLTSYIVIVDDNQPLNPQEIIMLQAAQHYITEHFKNLAPSENSKQGVSNSSEAAAAAATAATATVAATAATVAEINESLPTDPSYQDDKSRPRASTPDHSLLSSSNSDADTTPADETVLSLVRKIINLEIWARKGRGFFGYSEPEGISDMKKLENASLNDIFNIATEKHCQSGLSSSTRANMTGRFYAMLFALRQADNTVARLDILNAFAKRELVANYQNLNSWGVCKVVLADTDIATLCNIANIQPSDIESLANPTATAASSTLSASAAAAAATVSSTSSASTAAADEAPQTGLRP